MREDEVRVEAGGQTRRGPQGHVKARRARQRHLPRLVVGAKPRHAGRRRQLRERPRLHGLLGLLGGPTPPGVRGHVPVARLVRGHRALDLDPLAAEAVAPVAPEGLRHRSGPLVAGHEADEAEASRPRGHRIHQDDGVRDRAEGLEVPVQVAGGGALWQAPHEELVRPGHGPLDVHLPVAHPVLVPQHRRRGRVVGEGHVAEAAGAAVGPPEHHRVGDGAVPREVLLDVLRGGAVGQATHEDLPRVAPVVVRGVVARRGAPPFGAPGVTAWGPSRPGPHRWSPPGAPARAAHD
mmetsp:Transcript_78833/g.223037  ORF Transcript_78833/g.223037 Transcript_78833/m.223037 type:complete len:293 (-) Transcript_78833:31-909(-)